MKVAIVLICLMTFFLLPVGKEKPVSKEIEPSPSTILADRPNLNISILLDLSDRIDTQKYPSKTMDFYQRDLGYIKSITETVRVHLMGKKIIQMKDHIQLFIEPAPSFKGLSDKLLQLNMTFTKSTASKSYINSITPTYESITKDIYESAINEGDYIGSDLWNFFKYKAHTFCIEKEYRNILVILTDGYMYHKDALMQAGNKTSYLTTLEIKKLGLNKSDWKEIMDKQQYGFLTAVNNLENLEVLVLGINPNPGNPYEQDVIYEYWTRWLSEMGVKKFELKTAYLPAVMDKVIKDFIINEP